ncbi:MAG: FAD-binding protein [Gemmatimonadetes bacterium]|nr:FAD-binding protein [Gemmatimonadota bacterium]
MYAIEPIGVVFPRHADDVVAAVQVAAAFGAPVLPRGGGTSLNGQTVGCAVVLDFSRHLTAVVELNPETRTARVQPGVVQDDLNRAAARHGLFFAPDTSTSDRATLGGMIGNNSCGSRSARYGMTIDHVQALETVLSDGSRASFGVRSPVEIEQRARAANLEGRLYQEIPRLVEARAQAIREEFPKYWRRSGGYRLERMLPESGPFNLAKLVIGSEGTLAITVEATIDLVPRPRAVTALAGHFKSVAAAIAAVEDARECDAATIELVDRTILDLARRSPMHGRLASALLIDEPEALLTVEFYGDSHAEALAGLERLETRWRAGGHGYALVRALTGEDQLRLRELRKAGLGLLMASGRGRERTLAFVEDTAVDPQLLPEYTARFARILEGHGLRAGFYGHASAGCLHVRPFMDLTQPGEVAKMRTVAEEVRDLVVEFGGMNSSEHGDGLARGEFNRLLFGDELYGAMREVKRLFDPEGRLNPGKKVDVPPMTEHLREPALPPAVRLTTHFPFDFEDGMRGAANRCMRIGACRKSADAGGTMCPSYMATRNEEHSTRGRANALVKALSASNPRTAFGDERLLETLDLCLECKACRRECPLAVDMAAMKSEVLAQVYQRHGVPLRARIFGHVRALNRMGSAFASVANRASRSRLLRRVAEPIIGLDRRRPLPEFQRETLTQWFRRRSVANAGSLGPADTQPPSGPAARALRGEVVFLADSFTSFTEPEIGRAAIELLERAGWTVRLETDLCCGRSLISKGLLPQARERHRALVARLGPAARAGVPIVGCEPSCVMTLRDELPALARGDPDAVAVARQARLVEELLVEALDDGALQPDPKSPPCGRKILLHLHCHQKAFGAGAASAALLRHIPGAEVVELDDGCCGMAGSFGYEREHYDLSMKIGELRLFPAVRSAPPDALVAATGTSCRQQIVHGTGRPARHPVEILRNAMPDSRPES